MCDFDFTEEEIKHQLAKLGYSNVPDSRLLEFKKDLEQLVKQEKSKSSMSSFLDDVSSSAGESVMSEPIITRPFQTQTRFDPQPYDKVEAPKIISHKPTESKYDKENMENVGKTYAANKTKRFDIFMPSFDVDTGEDIADIEGGVTTLVRDGPPPANTEEAHPSHRRVAWSNDDSDSRLVPSVVGDKKFIKRKVLRKVDGQSIIDESVTESEADGLENIQQRLREVALREPPYRSRSVLSDHHSSRSSRPMSARSSQPSFRLPENHSGAPGLIKPMSKAPHTKNLKKCDVVSRYMKYKQSWQANKAPGEKAHKGLRWNVREQMSHQDKIIEKKTPKTYVANSYVVPGDKSRKDLRWQIRMDLAQGVMPSGYCD